MTTHASQRKELLAGAAKIEAHFSDADAAEVMPDLIFLADWEKGAALPPSAFLRIRQIRRAMLPGDD